MADRAAILQSLQSRETFDLLVIGGGATGCGVALDAAARGLTVALAEKGDFGSGTSGKSTKLIHGGVRYLELALLHFDRVQFNLVRDALRERATLLRIAPHLCRPLPLITPLYSYLHFPYFLAGLKLYDLLAGRRGLAPSRVLSRDQVLARFPLIRREGLKGGVLYYDGQFNDARMNLALALTALEHGASVANYLEVVALLRDGERVAGARVRDNCSGAVWDIAARCVVNACGPCCDMIRRQDDPDCQPLLRPSSGVHLALAPGLAPLGTGLVIPRTEDGRLLFVLPWLGGCLAGTTERPVGSCADNRVTGEEVEYLLRHLGRYFSGIERQSVTASWGGVRPLVGDPADSDTARLARDHVINRSRSGLITITGGKWTTYRKMAQDTVDFAVQAASLTPRHGCLTEGIILHGGEGCREEAPVSERAFKPIPTPTLPLKGRGELPGGEVSAVRSDFGLEPDTAAHLRRNYGNRATAVAELCRNSFAERVAPGHPYLLGEALYAARQELAVSALDFLVRRIPLALLDIKAAKGGAAAVVEVMGRELSWNEERMREERQAVEALQESRD